MSLSFELSFNPIDKVITYVYTYYKGSGHMTTKLKKIGNSQGIIIPSSMLRYLNISEKEMLDIELKGDEIILSKAVNFDPKSLEELFDGYEGKLDSEIVFDDVKGREIW